MVDEYLTVISGSSCATLVQIPLWSMNTPGWFNLCQRLLSFRFLYGRWILGQELQGLRFPSVQIPLWSMNTLCAYVDCLSCRAFRFLYGRWIHFSSHLMTFEFLSSDSSMVDEYHLRKDFNNSEILFRFLYGRWIRWGRLGCRYLCPSSDSSMVDEYFDWGRSRGRR